VVATQIRLNEAVEQYLAQRRANCAPSTALNDAYVLHRFAKSVGDIQVRHLAPHHVDRWFYDDKRGLAATLKEPSTINNYRKRLVAFFRYCAQRAWLRTDPMVNIGVRKVWRRERLQLSASQMVSILDLAPNPRDRVYLAINVNTGLRASEIVALRVRDVDLAAGDLRVVIYKTTEEDTMPITIDLDRELRRWLTLYEADLGERLVGEMYLVPARTPPTYQYLDDGRGGLVQSQRPSRWQPYKPLTNPANVVKSALRKMGLPDKGEGSHTLRRSIARIYFDMLADRGYDSALRATSSLLHHKDAATTESYLGLTRERKHRDHTLRGQPFLSALVKQGDNVVRLPHKRTGE
jgi:integrase